ncbi:hypothetical protein GWK36_02245 [Caldichromatium japonicum]|uniref:Lipoprotein n=1 Tax=Caldichromatium japonicum TaxID=2699430 RepID=A0A6G7VAG9_9GAMM|nr:hypothetical protein [Caldichromatium japonicum]QIK37011.1 hypothetical protein GWK36_02245 [Caldichromatium japonicum]
MSSRSYPSGLSACILALLLGGCQFNPLKPTQTPSALEGACAAACESLKNQCAERQRAREQLCQEERVRLADPKRTCQPGSDPLCPQPIDCLGEELTPCTVQYGECTVRCTSSPAEQNKQAG